MAELNNTSVELKRIRDWIEKTNDLSGSFFALDHPDWKKNLKVSYETLLTLFPGAVLDYFLFSGSQDIDSFVFDKISGKFINQLMRIQKQGTTIAPDVDGFVQLTADYNMFDLDVSTFGEVKTMSIIKNAAFRTDAGGILEGVVSGSSEMKILFPAGSVLKHNSAVGGSGEGMPFETSTSADITFGNPEIVTFTYHNSKQKWLMPSRGLSVIVPVFEIPYTVKIDSAPQEVVWNNTFTSDMSVISGDGTPPEALVSGVPKTHNYLTNGTFSGIMTTTDLSGVTAIREVGSDKRISSIFEGFTGSLSLQELDLQGNAILKSLDLQGVTVGNLLRLQNCLSLTEIKNFVSNETFTLLWASNCDLTGILNISGVTKLGGNVDFSGNAKLTQVLNPVSTQVFSSYNVSNCGLDDVLDISTLTGMGGSFNASSNPDLKQIHNPISNVAFSLYSISSCTSFAGILDISGLTKFGGGFNSSSCPLLTDILNPISAQVFNSYYATDCGITNLDLSGLTGLAGGFRVHGNPMTSITFPVTSGIFTFFRVNDCLFTSLDLSGLLNLGNAFWCYNNVGLTTVTNPPSNETFDFYLAYNCDLGYVDFSVMPNMLSQANTVIQLNDNNMTVSEVNRILFDHATLVTGESGGGDYTGRTVRVDGTNAAPDGSSGGFDGTASVTTLQGKSITVTTT